LDAFLYRCSTPFALFIRRLDGQWMSERNASYQVSSGALCVRDWRRCCAAFALEV